MIWTARISEMMLFFQFTVTKINTHYASKLQRECKATPIRFIVSLFPTTLAINYLTIHTLYKSIYIVILMNIDEAARLHQPHH